MIALNTAFCFDLATKYVSKLKIEILYGKWIGVRYEFCVEPENYSKNTWMCLCEVLSMGKQHPPVYLMLYVHAWYYLSGVVSYRLLIRRCYYYHY